MPITSMLQTVIIAVKTATCVLCLPDDVEIWTCFYLEYSALVIVIWSVVLAMSLFLTEM